MEIIDTFSLGDSVLYSCHGIEKRKIFLWRNVSVFSEDTKIEGEGYETDAPVEIYFLKTTRMVITEKTKWWPK